MLFSGYNNNNNKISWDVTVDNLQKVETYKDLSLRYLISPSAIIFTAASSMNTDVKKKLNICSANSNSCKNTHHQQLLKW